MLRAGPVSCRVSLIHFLVSWLKGDLNEALVSLGLVLLCMSSFHQSLFSFLCCHVAVYIHGF